MMAFVLLVILCLEIGTAKSAPVVLGFDEEEGSKLTTVPPKAPPPTEWWISKPGENNCGTDWATGEYEQTSDDIVLEGGTSYKTCTRSRGWWTVDCGENSYVKCRPGIMWTLYASDGSKCECQQKN